MASATATATQKTLPGTASASDAEMRTPRIGMVVWYSSRPAFSMKNDQLETCPAIITRVNDPSNPRSNLALAVLSPSIGVKTPYGVPYSEHPTDARWSWPGEVDPEPVFQDGRHRDLSLREPAPLDR